ncbi:MAG TPA: MupA/Atu3671 family FMN-dependent luciferase-like monooxygenase [Kofleriaceae bacterium]|jgi:natural product biosynthesis luciferase-like monooxygenase protein|nr:MupA/Atu3671 family FMN-dependent luciferase-like monooxygenase [Kofleriaceae bacterium]
MTPRPPLQLSLFFFAASPEDAPGDVYRLLVESTRFADRHGFAAVWTPERHFQEFGGPYPNPSLTSAALATITSQIRLRAGSVVAPLQSALRIAEEWAVVDNLSHGRVGVSFASGWHADDFVLAPAIYRDRRRDMIEKLETVKKLWRGEKITLSNGEGREIQVGILPRPIQPELDIWLTCQEDANFATTGELGYKVLTNLNGKRLADLDRKCRLYHDGHERAHGRRGHFTLMAHTFVGTDDDHVWKVAGRALARYLELRVDMDAKLHEDLELSAADREFLARRGTAQFLGETSLIGTPETCAARARRFYDAGVDEIACLIDFGVPFDEAMASLERLATIKAQLA